jgi:hypothetical protein
MTCLPIDVIAVIKANPIDSQGMMNFMVLFILLVISNTFHHIPNQLYVEYGT